VTSAYQVGLTWQEGTYNGGSPVIDYRVTYKGEFETDYIVFSEGVVLTSHTVIGLTPSYRYYFQVEARNLVGYSAKSAEILVLAAQIPDAPTDLANVPEITTAS
jgi:hypothetical protein